MFLRSLPETANCANILSFRQVKTCVISLNMPPVMAWSSIAHRGLLYQTEQAGRERVVVK